MGQGHLGDVLRDRFLFRKVEPRWAIEDLKVLVLVKMLDVASDRVDFTHQTVMARADEELSSALKLVPPLSWLLEY
jgi:hypothetical protein